MFDSSDIIFSYSRQDALNDGLQVLVSDAVPSVQALVPLPIFFTSPVWELCQAQPDPKQTIFDLCSQMLLTAQKHPDQTLISFNLYFANNPLVFAEIGCIDSDNPNPAITVMFPHEH